MNDMVLVIHFRLVAHLYGISSQCIIIIFITQLSCANSACYAVCSWAWAVTAQVGTT